MRLPIGDCRSSIKIPMNDAVANSPAPRHQSSIVNRQRIDWPPWAIYLGISWTWCIGMFLPVLLIRDYGFWSFFAFALPNVIGAAAMGWVLRTTAESERFAAAHSVAMSAFSFVTVCFHAFFLGWISQKMLGRPDLVAAAFFGTTIVLLVLMRLRDGNERWLAIAAALVSWFIFARVLRYRMNLGIVLPDMTAGGSMAELSALAAVCVLGFALCPYVDRTFHLARRQLNPAAAKKAFGFGFGAVFFSMILFTLIYSDLIGIQRVNQAIVLMLLIHLIVQSAFTAAAHTTAMPGRRLVVITMLIAGVGFVGGMYANRIEYNGIAGGEIGYRLFMSFYGLLAPAYVWIVGARSAQRPTRAHWLVFSTTVVAALPFYWLAFIEKQMAWAAIGVGFVVLGRAFTPRRSAAHATA